MIEKLHEYLLELHRMGIALTQEQRDLLGGFVEWYEKQDNLPALGISVSENVGAQDRAG